MQQQNLFPVRPSDQHRLLERMASARLADDQAREIIASPKAHQAFIAELCAGMYWAAGKRQ